MGLGQEYFVCFGLVFLTTRYYKLRYPGTRDRRTGVSRTKYDM